MRRYLTVLLISSLAVLAFSGCSRRVTLFSIEGGDGVQSIRVREVPGQAEGDEGYLLPAAGVTPLYRLRRPLQVQAGGEVWRFRLTDVTGELTVNLQDRDGRVVAGRTLQAAANEVPDLLLLLAIPGGVEVSAFQVLAVPGPGAAGDGMRLVGVSREGEPLMSAAGPATAAAGVRHEESLTVGLDTHVHAWGADAEGEVTWVVSASGGRWGASDAVIVEYVYTPAEAGRGAGTSAGESVVPTVVMAAAGGGFAVSLRPGRHSVVIHPEAEGVDARRIAVRSAVPGFAVTAVIPSAGLDADAPLVADLGTVLRYPPSLWRSKDYELFRWSLFPEVLIVDTRDYAAQARFFKRLAFFVEKEGYRGQILTNSDLAGRHGYNAHNYNGDGLAGFFTAAGARGVELNEEELLLRSIAEREGMIVRNGAGFAAGAGGILAVSQESWGIPGLRELLLTHEAYHGVFYADPAYVAAVEQLWNSLSDSERRYWLLLLDGMQYDTADDYLVINEFQAYLLQQPVRSAPWYFTVRSADRLRSWKPAEASWIDQFLRSFGGSFLDQARAANALLFERTGLIAGSVLCLVPTDDQPGR